MLIYFLHSFTAGITYDNEVVMSPDFPHVGNSVLRIASCRTIELHQLWGKIIKLMSININTEMPLA